MSMPHTITNWLKDLVVGPGRVTKDCFRFARGYARFLATGQLDNDSFRALRRLYHPTGGLANQMAAALHRWTHPIKPLEPTGTVVQGLNFRRVQEIVQALDRDGYCVIGKVVPDELCGQLIHFARSTPMTVVSQDGKVLPERMLFDSERPAGIRFLADTKELLSVAAAKVLVSDPGLLTIAQSYFRALAVQDNVAMWWTASSSSPSSAAAQLYHFDMDRVKFLKFFLYLSDVGPENGPHCFVSGSHRRSPMPLRRDGRHTDTEVFRYFSRDKEAAITGPCGTLTAVDTLGMHKGRNVSQGYRLIFEVEYAINAFGAEYEPLHMGDPVPAAIRERMRRHPYAFSNYRNGGDR